MHPSDPQDDDALMRDFAAGGPARSREAFAALVRRHQRNLVNFFLRLGVDHPGSEDCAQETFLRLHRQRKRYRPRSTFGAYLYTLARSVWVDGMRRASRRRTVRLEDGAIAVDGPQGRLEERIDLREALEQLPDHWRWVLLLSTQEGLSYEEIGRVLSIPVGTVKSRMHYALQKLRGILLERTRR